MNKKDIKDLVIFIVLIIIIIGLFTFNLIKNKKTDNVDRKILYLFDGLSYNKVDEVSRILFNNGIKLVNNSALEYDRVDTYFAKDLKNLKRISNFNLVNSTFKGSEVKKFIELKNIVEDNGNYYLSLDNYKVSNNYVGSIIELLTYDSTYVTYKSINYYCDNNEFIGLLTEEPTCNYSKNETTFKVIYENYNLRLNSVEEINNIIK